MNTITDIELRLAQRVKLHACYGEEFVAILDGPNLDEIAAAAAHRAPVEFLVADSALCALFSEGDIALLHANGVDENAQLLAHTHPEFTNQAVVLKVGFLQAPRVNRELGQVWFRGLCATIKSDPDETPFGLVYINDRVDNAYVLKSGVNGQFRMSRLRDKG